MLRKIAISFAVLTLAIVLCLAVGLSAAATCRTEVATWMNR